MSGNAKSSYGESQDRAHQHRENAAHSSPLEPIANRLEQESRQDGQIRSRGSPRSRRVAIGFTTSGVIAPIRGVSSAAQRLRSSAASGRPGSSDQGPAGSLSVKISGPVAASRAQETRGTLLVCTPKKSSSRARLPPIFLQYFSQVIFAHDLAAHGRPVSI
jgi:hypothetical protein